MSSMTTAPFASTLELNQAARTDAEREAILASPGFGNHFTDHMFLTEWTPEAGWHDARVVPYGPLQLDPATAVLHYAQEIFEGLKAYAWADGSIRVFRPEQNRKVDPVQDRSGEAREIGSGSTRRTPTGPAGSRNQSAHFGGQAATGAEIASRHQLEIAGDIE